MKSESLPSLFERNSANMISFKEKADISTNRTSYLKVEVQEEVKSIGCSSLEKRHGMSALGSKLADKTNL